MINRPAAKQAAQNCMRSARANPMLVGALFVLLISLMSIVDTFMLQKYGFIDYYMDMPFLMPSAVNIFVSVLIMLISAVLNAGLVHFCLNIRRGREMPVTALFDGFSMVGRIVWLQIQMVIRIWLWSMLFLIPGIIAAYRYRFALLNLLEDPDISAGEAIRLSCTQTAGYKMELFMLDLSFIGWFIANMFTMGILNIWLQPYYTLTNIAYYDWIRADKGMISGGGSSSFSRPHTPAQPYNDVPYEEVDPTDSGRTEDRNED